MASKSNLLFSFHRRFLLRSKLGRSWRASLSAFATQRGLILHPNSLSHVVAADWHSRDFAFERLIAEVLALSFREVWPEYAGVAGIEQHKNPQPIEGHAQQAA